MEAIKKFIASINQHPDVNLPAWLTAAVTELVFDFSGQQERIRENIDRYIDSTVEHTRPAALRRLIESAKDQVQLPAEDCPPADNHPVATVRMDPADRLDIDRIFTIDGMTLNSQTAALEMIQRCAGIVRVLARVLALKHAKPDEAAALGASIVHLTQAANHLREHAGGGEVDFSEVAVHGPQAAAVEAPPVKEKVKRNWSPERRAAAAERMRRISLEMHARKRSQDGKGGEPDDGATFPAGGEEAADGIAAA